VIIAEEAGIKTLTNQPTPWSREKLTWKIIERQA
jgi:hypothetical protein